MPIKFKFFILLSIFLFIGILTLSRKNNVILPIKKIKESYREYELIKLNSEEGESNFEAVRVRDFKFYKCNNIKRIGGKPEYLKNAPDDLFRIDGAWFICLDHYAQPKKSQCNVLSLGINTDFTFDQEMRDSYDCNLYSFDPFVEDPFFTEIRNKKPELKESPVIEVNNKWFFYRLGIGFDSKETKNLNQLKIQDIVSFENILKITGLENKIIDVFKMDIEGPEKDVINNMDMDYACKYFKNLIFETHANCNFKDLEKLEKCFRLFYRSTRFFKGDTFGAPTGHLTEFQNPNGWKLDIKQYENEIKLAEFMFTSGELYFVNINFLK
ncbi:unnamed protein product [Brachionus calyciflorus]|uniref:Methyltransferase domain-containing protein n=1 Tax=Brachionus calyciflorus TaxID=104777 RepID=A0A814DMX4_9BILA|nr:unnamed protein product [Brachionus calyciflorus]